MKTILKTGLAVAFALGLAGTALAQSRTPLTVYTAVENDQLEPFKQAIEAGVGTIMPSYSTWNGVRCSASHRLLTEILKEELGFEGFLISD